MNFLTPQTLDQVFGPYDVLTKGNLDQLATGINEIHKVRKGDITFVDHPKYYDKSLQSPATIIIIDKEVDCPEDKTLVIHPRPFEVYNDIVRRHRPIDYLTDQSGVHNSIDPTAIIEPGAILGNYVTVGAHSYIQSQAVLRDHTLVGNHVNIQSGAILGTDAFYYKKTNLKYTKWRSGGRVIIKDHVEIGAGCTINKGVSGDTIIGEGSKLDCQIHIGHGVVLGKHCLLAAQVGVGGKTVIGDHVTIYGQVGIGQSLTIGDHATILGKSGVTKSLEGHKTYFGYPAAEARDKYKELATLKRLLDQ